jgi:antitoxin VapB
MNHPKKEDSSMPISIKDPETDAKIRDLAGITGETITVAVRIAIEQRLQRESARRRSGVAKRLLDLARQLPKREHAQETAEMAIGYDANGLPS